MDSKTLIYNRVLTNLGISGKIQHYGENTFEAITIGNFYNLARDYVLKDFDWGFACTYKQLSLASNPNNNTLSGYLYEYHYPDDCIAARALYVLGDTEKTERKFDISCIDNSTLIILANVKPAVLKYTKRIDKEKLFPAEFEMSLSLYLAAVCAEALTGSAQRADRLLQRYELFKRRSQKLNAEEGRASDENNSTYIDSRF